jgi:hypothetical protein
MHSESGSLANRERVSLHFISELRQTANLGGLLARILEYRTRSDDFHLGEHRAAHPAVHGVDFSKAENTKLKHA